MSRTKSKSMRTKHGVNGVASPSARGNTRSQKMIAGLKAVVETLEAGGRTAVSEKFTVRTIRRAGFGTPALGATDVVKIRAELGVSQAVLAALLGVSTNTVRAWEQGNNPLSGIASRFLSELRRDPDYWKARVSEADGKPIARE